MWPFKRRKWEELGLAKSSIAVRDSFRNLAPKAINLRDRDYRAIPAKHFEQIIFDCWFPNDEPAYKSEIFDCDDFAVCFMAEVKKRWAKVSRGKEALAFGYIAADVKGIGLHAFIWHLSPEGRISFYEPQSKGCAPVGYKIISVALVET